jgi:hypothetical protein
LEFVGLELNYRVLETAIKLLSKKLWGIYIVKKTISEQLFEQFCYQNKISLKDIPREKNNKTPDYSILLDDDEIFVEVMEFELDASDEKKFKKGEMITWGGTIGNTVRIKIKKGNKQLREKTQGQKPGIIVLFNNSIFDHNSPYKIMTAMYGLEQYKINIPTGDIVNRTLGPKKTLTKKDNTSTSAIMTLHKDENNILSALLFHNKHSSSPLNKSLFMQISNVEQFNLSENEKEWEKLGG